MTPKQKRALYYLSNKHLVIARKIQIRNACREYLQKYKESHPCTDCKKIYPYYVMDFDHLGNKEFQLSRNENYTSLARIKREMAKCELVCANCHRIRTHNRRVEASGKKL